MEMEVDMGMWILIAGVVSLAALLLLNLFKRNSTLKDLSSSMSSEIQERGLKPNLHRRLVLEILMSAGCPKSFQLKLETNANFSALTNLASSLSSNLAEGANATTFLNDLLKSYDRSQENNDVQNKENPKALAALEDPSRGSQEPSRTVRGQNVHYSTDLIPRLVNFNGSENDGTFGFKAILDSGFGCGRGGGDRCDETCIGHSGLEFEVKISEDDVAAPKGSDCQTDFKLFFDGLEQGISKGEEGDDDDKNADIKMKKKKKCKRKKPTIKSNEKRTEEKDRERLEDFIARAKEQSNAVEVELGCTCGILKGDLHQASCPYPFTSSASVIQRKIKQQYDELVQSNAARALTLAQVGRFTNCLVEAKAALQQRSETIQRKFTIAKSLLLKADKSSFDRLCGQIYRLETEQKRLEEDTVVYNRLQEQLKLSPAYQKMLEYGRTHFQSQNNTDQLLEKPDQEDAEISFEELLAQEKKDSFWQKHGRFRSSVSVS
eukprot:Gb_22488 [translate_table: standard]